MTKKRAKWIVSRLILMLFSGFVALCLAELVVRFSVEREVAGAMPVHRILEALPDSPRKYGLRPSSKVLGYTINTSGFRGAEISRDKPADCTRIICLGDSVCFAMGVYEAELTGCERLDALMNADATGAWEVINAGVPGYNTVQEYHYLTETLLAYDPDIVVLHFCMNDADPIELEFEAPTALRKTAAMEAHDLSLRTLINQSYLLRLLKDVILERNPRLRNAAFNYRVQEKAWGVMKDYLARIDETLRERGIPFVVVLYPYRVQLAADPANVLPQQDLASFFKERGTSCIDLQESFRANGGPSLILDDGFHPTADGHALAAEAIRGELRRVLSGDAAR